MEDIKPGGGGSGSGDQGGYRYGFNGQEKSDEIAAGLTTAKYWEYDSRIGRRWNTDPLSKPWESPYACFNNNPIFFADPSGLVGEPPYKVKSGDNLSKIAKQAGVTVAILLAVKGNEGYRKNPNDIKPGQTIQLPVNTPTAQPVNNKTFVLEPVQQRTPGLDFMGKGALPLPKGGGAKGQDGLSEPLNKANEIAENGEYFFKLVGKNGIAEKFSTVGSVFTGVSVVNHLANGNLKGTATDIVEYGISRSPAAPYYYGGKLLNETFFGNSTLSKAYWDWNDQKKILISNFHYWRQQGEEGEVDKIQKQLITIERGQAKILETLQARKKADE